MLIVGNDASLVQIREKFRTNQEWCYNGKGEEVPIAEVAAIAAGVVLNDNMDKFSISCK